MSARSPRSGDPKKILEAARRHLPDGVANHPRLRDIVAALAPDIDDPADAARLLAPLAPGRRPSDENVDALLTVDPGIDVMLSCFAQIALRAGQDESDFFAPAYRAASEVTGLAGPRMDIPLSVMLVGDPIFPCLDAVAEVLGPKEVTTRAYAAIHGIRGTLEREPHQRPRPLAATNDNVMHLARRLLSHPGEFTAGRQKYLSALVAQDMNLVDAADAIAALDPEASKADPVAERGLLADAMSDVALLCFVQVFAKGDSNNDPDTYRKAERAAIEVTGMKGAEFVALLRLSLLGRTAGVGLPVVCQALGAGEVGARVKRAIARIGELRRKAS
ncbi:hypothetical protein K8I61_14895 [bacterium]|nr:hypothetical protein [bacterium]